MPDDVTPTSGSSATSGSTTGTEPSSVRPREINLEGKDPCAQISQSDWPKLGIERPGKRSEEPNFRSPNCYYSAVGDVTLIVTEGMEEWYTRTHNVEIDDARAIAGFPTITIWNDADGRSCYTAVDVANGQHLLTTARTIEVEVDEEATCGQSYHLAESAMKTLVAS